MNYQMIRYLLGKTLGIEALLSMLPFAVGLIYKEDVAVWFLISAAFQLLTALMISAKKPDNTRFGLREGMIIVSSTWILWSVFGALPECMSGFIPSYLDSFFETLSGFTTTGSTVLTSLSGRPKCMLFWRSLTHWIGGMGMLLFIISIDKASGRSAIHLMRAEMPGPVAKKLFPKAKNTAIVLYFIYLALTGIMVVCLLLGGMNLYDSVIHALGTAGTGGFSNYTASVGYFNDPVIEWILIVFMLMFGINFHLHYFMLIGKPKLVFRNEELRAYLLITVSSIALITANIADDFLNLKDAVRTASFQVVSVISTTGYVTKDYDYWPTFSLFIILALMFIGACSCSTGGGVKVSRIIILVKSFARQIRKMLRPNSVEVIRINGQKIDRDTINGIFTYFTAYFFLFILSLIVIAVDGKDFETTISAVLTALGNVGPGMGEIGPTGNFSSFSPLSKIVLCVDMLAGRLEFFPLLLIFSLPFGKHRF